MNNPSSSTQGEETWRKGERLSPPVGSDRDIYMFYFAGVGVALEENIGDQILADHTAASTLRTELEAYKKAWELPEQPVTQGVVPSAGEVAANAVEEARIYRDQRDALRTALTEAQAALQSIEDLLGDALAYLRPPCGDEALGTALPWVEAADKEATKALAALHTPTGAGTAEAN